MRPDEDPAPVFDWTEFVQSGIPRGWAPRELQDAERRLGHLVGRLAIAGRPTGRLVEEAADLIAAIADGDGDVLYGLPLRTSYGPAVCLGICGHPDDVLRRTFGAVVRDEAGDDLRRVYFDPPGRAGRRLVIDAAMDGRLLWLLTVIAREIRADLAAKGLPPPRYFWTPSPRSIEPEGFFR